MTDPLEQTEAASKPRRKRRRLRFILVALLLILGIAFARFAWLRITLEPTPRPEYWQAQIAALDPPPAGALSKDEAAELLADRPWETQPPLTSFSKFSCTDTLQGPWDSTIPTFAAVEKVFASQEFKTILGRMRQASQRGWLPPVDLATFASRTDYRHWVRWLAAHSRWEAQVNKDSQAAAEDWLAALAISRQLRRSRLLIDHLSAVACDTLVASEVMIQAREPLGPLDSAVLARRIDETLGPLLPPSQLLAGEWMGDRNCIDKIFVRQGGNWLNVKTAAEECSKTLRGTGTLPANAIPSRLWNLFSPLFNDVDTAASEVDRYYASLGACTDLATCWRIQTGKPGTIIARVPGPLSGFARSPWGSIQVGSFDYNDYNLSGLRLYYCARCQIEAGIAMLGLREYHRRNNRYPDRLDQLVPDFLPRLPIDYADRKSLRYRRNGDDYVLYSIGLNGQDDGGKGATNPNKGSLFNEENPDTVFSDVRRGKR